MAKKCISCGGSLMAKQAVKAGWSLLYDLLDLSVLPAALITFSKVFSIVVLNFLLGLDWSVRGVGDSLFGFGLVYGSRDDAVLVISYSNLFMFIAAIAGSMLVTSKTLLLNHRKASPYFVLRLAKYDLLHLLKSSVHLYKEAFVWGAFLVVTTIYIVVSAVSGITYPWIAALSLLFCLVFLWILVRNIEEEILFHHYR